MRLTRRGYGLVGVVVGAELLALTYGGRALNAVAAPLLIALVAAAVTVYRDESPTVDRTSVPPGFPDDTRTVTVEVTGSGVVRLADALPAGVAGRATAETTLPTTFTYDVTLEERGQHELGPLDVQVTDVLGLVTNSVETHGTTSVLVYPPVSALAGQKTVLSDAVDRNAVERQEFESVREYAPGDPLRDVHWKSTAKDPGEMYVAEFADSTTEEKVVLAASSTPNHADEMAAAAASVAVMAIDAGVDVELRTASGVVEGSGSGGRDRILRHLAVADGGHVPDDDDTDARVVADSDGVTLTVGSRDHEFAELTVDRVDPFEAAGVSA